MIYYIYKVRRKQTSIRFSRSALPHRYLRSISWKGISPLQAGVSTCAPLRVASCAPACDGVPHQAAPLPLLLPGGQANALRSFPKKKKKPSSSSLAHLSHVAPPVQLCPRPLARAAHDPSAAGPSRRFLRPSHKQKMRARSIAPRTRSKKRRLLAQEKHTQARPAFTLLLRPQSTARIHYCPFSFLLFYKGKEKRKQKQIQQVRIHRSDSLRSSSRCTRLARRASSAKIYVAIATRFVQDCVEDLAVLMASMERIPKCSWHIKDQCLGVIKANRISLLLLRLLSS